MITLSLIIAVVILAINYNKLSNENIKLKEILRKNNLLDEINKPVEYTFKKETPSIVENKNVIKEKPKYTDKEIKNSSILIVGSILVVLSAIIFLATTWNVTNNIFKAIMLFGMLLIFYLASYIAKKINLNQTYKAFHYIALAYIPISLLSLWVFKLIGEYLSIDGEGALLYLAVCSFIVSGIYYMDSSKKESKTIGVISILLLILGISFICLKYELSIEYILFGILLLGVLFTLLHKIKKYYISESLTIIGMNTIMFMMIFIQIIASLVTLLLDEALFISTINSILIMYLIYYSTSISDTKKIFNAIYPLLIFFIFLNLTGIIDYTFIKEIIMLISFVVVCIFELLNNKKIRNTTFYHVIAASTILYFFTSSNNSIHSYIVLLVSLVIAYIFYYQDEEKKNYKMYYVSLLSYLSIIDIVNFYDLSVSVLGYTTLIIVTLVTILNNKIYNPLKNVGYILMFIITPFISFGSFSSILLFELFTILLLVYSINNKNKYNRIVSYIYFNISTLHLFKYLGALELNDYLLVLPICNIFVFILELLLNEKEKVFNKNLLYIYYGISSLVLVLLNDELIHLILMIINTVLLYYYCKVNGEDKKYTYVGYIMAIPFMFFGDTLLFASTNYMNDISLLTIIIFAFLINKTRDNKFTIMYFIYLVFNTLVFNNSKYLILVLFTVGCLINYLYRNNKIKDLFKALLYTCALVFSQFAVYDLNINNIAILTYGMYMIYFILLNRSILKKYVNAYKVVEYISLVLINILAIINFISEADGLIFVILLILLVIVSYGLKYGPTFIVSLIFIVINAILLTKEFWLSLPWWLYVLIIGFILISFAIINEIKDKRNSGLIVKKIKEDLDL